MPHPRCGIHCHCAMISRAGGGSAVPAAFAAVSGAERCRKPGPCEDHGRAGRETEFARRAHPWRQVPLSDRCRPQCALLRGRGRLDHLLSWRVGPASGCGACAKGRRFGAITAPIIAPEGEHDGMRYVPCRRAGCAGLTRPLAPGGRMVAPDGMAAAPPKAAALRKRRRPPAQVAPRGGGAPRQARRRRATAASAPKPSSASGRAAGRGTGDAETLATS